MSEESKKEDVKELAFKDDPILSALAEDIPALVETEKKKEEPPVAPEVKPVEEGKPKGDGEKKAEEKPEKKDEEAKPKVSLKKRDSKVIADEVVAAVREVLPLPPKQEKKEEPPPEKKDHAVDESNLNKDQKAELDDARYLEARNPQWKGRSDELLKFYKRVDDWVASKKDDENRTFDQNDEEFMKFVTENRPAWADKDSVRRARLKEEVKEEIRKEQDPEIEAAKAEAREARLSPRIKSAVDAFESELESQSTSEDPLESTIYSDFRKGAVQLANDHLRLVNGLAKKDDPSADADTKARYEFLDRFITTQASYFEKNGGDARVRDGKIFVSPEKLDELKRKGSPEADKAWTFSPGDVLKMLQAYTLQAAKTAVEAEEKRVEKLGFKRAKKETPSKTAEEIKPEQGVKVTPSRAPGAAPDSKTEDINHVGLEIIDVLELRR